LSNTTANRELTPPYFRLVVRLIRPFPNFDLWFVKSIRRKAVELLHLNPGDRALDGGCGPGGSFPFLVNAVGPSGEVVGVEISPEVAINAFSRATFASTPQLAFEPWTLLEQRLGKFEIREYCFGIFFVACGPTLPPAT
jgi:hypothetical protein